VDIEWIKNQIRVGEYLWSKHADEERRNDNFSVSEVEQSVLSGKILEDYPNDQRGSSCLIGGKCGLVDIHTVCGKNKIETLVIITVYKPSLPKWRSPTERIK
jgi:hypothetical protein